MLAPYLEHLQAVLDYLKQNPIPIAQMAQDLQRTRTEIADVLTESAFDHGIVRALYIKFYKEGIHG
jgi:hypothetical protein